MKAVNASLASRQQQLLNDIFSMAETEAERSVFDANGLKIYQNNLLMTAAKALSITYPVTEQMIGEEAMIAVARELLKRESPNTGDWADWGGELSAFFAEHTLGEENPFLIDMATLEWQMHQVSRARSIPIDDEQLHQIANQQQSEFQLKIASHVRLLKSEFPLAALWGAHQSSNHSGFVDALSLVQEINEHTGFSYLLIYQAEGLYPVFQLLSHEEYQWIEKLSSGVSLQMMIEQYPEFDFTTWFVEAISNHWIELHTA